jgi:hypothetical protein
VHFFSYTGKDPIGVELAGALKNVFAIAAGTADGLGFENNTRAGKAFHAYILGMGGGLDEHDCSFSDYHAVAGGTDSDWGCIWGRAIDLYDTSWCGRSDVDVQLAVEPELYSGVPTREG